MDANAKNGSNAPCANAPMNTSVTGLPNRAKITNDSTSNTTQPTLTIAWRSSSDAYCRMPKTGTASAKSRALAAVAPNTVENKTQKQPTLNNAAPVGPKALSYIFDSVSTMPSSLTSSPALCSVAAPSR